MRVLIIGYSNIVRRRVLPALRQMPVVTGIDIASRSSADQIASNGTPSGSRDSRDSCDGHGHVYDEYDIALAESRADLAYVSLVNSAHAYWVEKALARGLHVVVDKPAFIDLRDTQRLTELAARKNLCLAEATVYTYHPQMQLVREVFTEAGSAPTHLTATFSFPPLNPDNFRYVRGLGGGALWDLGPYAVTPGRIFFGQEPDQVFCRATKDPGHGVDISFSLLATYPGGRSMVGHFGFATEYRNHLTVLGPGASVDVDRVFTTPAEMENELRVRAHNVETILTAPKADHFQLFLQAVVDAIQRGDHRSFAQDLYTDATVLHRVRADAVHASVPGE